LKLYVGASVTTFNTSAPFRIWGPFFNSKKCCALPHDCSWPNTNHWLQRYTQWI